MSAAPSFQPAVNATQRYSWRMTFVFWLLICAAFLARAYFMRDQAPLTAGNDDAMRLTVIRDWMAGQNWFDHTQYRINTPFGAQIHWSRLIDAPIAALILGFSALFPGLGETIAVIVWPLLLLLALLAVSSRLAVALVGAQGQLPGLALPVFSLSIMAEFAPGRIDHHSVQIILVLALVWTTIGALENPRMGLWAGLLAATSLAIGTGGIVMVAAAILAFGLMWAISAHRAPALRAFGLAFALGTLGHFVLFLPPSAYLAVHCDVLSIVYLLAALGVGATFSALPLLPIPQHSIALRLTAGVITGGLLAMLLVWRFPLCVGGPYAGLDPYLVSHWLNAVSEAKSAPEALGSMPGLVVSLLLPAVFAIAVVLWRIWRAPASHKSRWLVYGLFLLLAFVTLLFQIRGARLAAAMTVPAGAWAIVMARRAYLARQKPLRAGILVLAWLGFAGIPIAIAVNFLLPAATLGRSAAKLEQGAQCIMPAAFTALAALPPQRIMAPVDLGAPILLNTGHSVVGAPYHRNQQGLIDTFRFFNGPPEMARDILAKRGITLVATCAGLPEMAGLPDTVPGALIREFARGRTPGWLKEISPQGAVLRLFEVKLDR